MSRRARAKRFTLRRDLADRLNRADHSLDEAIDRLLQAIRRGLVAGDREQARAEVERREVEL